MSFGLVSVTRAWTAQEHSPNFDWKWFRYPFLHEGDTLEKRNAVRSFLKEKGYKIAQVTIDFNDWAYNNPYARCVKKGKGAAIREMRAHYLKNAVDELKRVRAIEQKIYGREVKHILLLHVGAFGAELMDDLLSAYKQEGVRFIALAEASKDAIYQDDPGFVSASGDTLLEQWAERRDVKIPSRPWLAQKSYLALACRL